MLRSIRNGLQLVAILLAVWGVLLLGEWLGVAGVGMRARSQAGNVVENTAKDVPAEARATLGHTPRIPSSRGIVVGGNAMGAGRLAVFKREQSFPGLTIYPISGTAEVLLLSHAGAVVHRWEVDADRARLLPNGNLLVVHGSKWGLTQPKWRNLRTTIREYAWSGEVVWEYRARDVIHHDLQRLPNGNTLFLERSQIPAELKGSIVDQRRRTRKIRSDSVVEIDHAGREIWRWYAHEHIDLNYCGKEACSAPVGHGSDGKKTIDWTHMNTVQVLPENKWFKADDQRFKPGNILLAARNMSTIFIIDRQTGEVVWQYSGDYKGGLSGVHEPQMIQPGLPGAGNILIFDNGRKKHVGQSFVLEIEPVNRGLVWKYDVGATFFSRIAGSQQRLPNGNTLISEDDQGRVFEVTPKGEIVWEYLGHHRSSRARRYPGDYLL